MGLGKTLTVLGKNKESRAMVSESLPVSKATIAHEKIPRRSHAPTLLVVPRSLIGQWYVSLLGSRNKVVFLNLTVIGSIKFMPIAYQR